ncbi:UbiH/UbiF family hydroxylase [Nereida sp. MMG025]|uniref:UbiH/UbiF family hydroxylase n=1 Tax=Nereida sp. MMG025 TaxID=2909981 RepID=UPI001F36C984|nr:UbiH/UbiF family hydroxylase [Nereida sp. MMG025]MCF6443780.1 UbiH/UbiF family hydroxylase [Nereida sp. MMG025]
MEKTQTDILISGGGVAGMTAAAAFGTAGFNVICVDPTPPITERDADGSDLRSTAFLQPSRDFLEDAGIWSKLDAHASPLQTMRIVDAGGVVNEPRLTRDFDASDISERPFGWNLPNWLLRREMVARLKELPNVDFRPGVGTASVLTRQTEARVSLSDGTLVSARMIIAADGRNSPVRRALGIGAKTTRYGQKALAFAVTHPIPHDGVSTEIHRSGGPFTLVPLPDYNGKPSSAIVWMERGPEARRLYELDATAFNEAISERSCHLFGPLTLASRRTIWPIISQISDSFYGERTALIAEAAHVVPPIGAQGLNMSIGDMRALLDLAQAAPDSLGSPKMLAAYERKRKAEVHARVAGVNLLNRASMMGEQPLRDLRAAGVSALYSMAPVRKTLMQLGLGARG